MDVSPKTLREVEFREKMRGYHPEDVDQFLEQVAAGIEVLQDRLRQAVERAQRAEQAAQAAQAAQTQAATDVSGADETLKRTLVLAQRTADMAVQEAREQAGRIVAGAEQQAQSLIADAELRARQAHEEGLIVARNELARLEKAREQAEMEVAALTRWIGEHRDQLVLALQQAISSVEKVEFRSPPPGGGHLDVLSYPYTPSASPTSGPGPTPLGPASPPPPPSPAPVSSTPTTGGVSESAPVSVPDDDLSAGAGAPAPPPQPTSGPVDAGSGGSGGSAEMAGRNPAQAIPVPSGPPPGAGGTRDSRPMPEPGRSPSAQAGEPTRMLPARNARDTMVVDDDAYFADLRQAVTGEHQALPREEDHEPGIQSTEDFYDQDFAEGRRFGGRLRRRR